MAQQLVGHGISVDLIHNMDIAPFRSIFEIAVWQPQKDRNSNLM